MKPNVSVVFPCRGLEPGLERNIRAVLGQDYPDFEVLLTTTSDDESLPLLKQLAAACPRARLVLAERATASAQKLANQLAALAAAGPATRIYAFIDSDGCVQPDYLTGMVRGLEEDGVGLVTGWWWYTPECGWFWPYVRAAWSAGAMPFLVDNKHNIASGGAMAIRKDVFDRSGAAQRWRHAVSDGLTLARAVKDLGLRVKFAPWCLVLAENRESFAEVVEWTNRQATISHVYMPAFWRFTALAYTMQIGLAIAALCLGGLVMGALGILIVLALYLGLMELNAWAVLRVTTQLLGEAARVKLRTRRWRYLLAAPVASWIYGLNVLRSTLSRRITWRGIQYVMVSPTETRVIPGTPLPFGFKRS